MDGNPADQEIFGLGISGIGSDGPGLVGSGDDNFVREENGRNPILGGGTGCAWAFGDGGHFGESFETTFGVVAECADPFGEVIDRDEEFFILGLEHLMEGEEVGSLNVPMSEVKLSQEPIRFSGNLIQVCGDGCDGGDLDIVCLFGDTHG